MSGEIVIFKNCKTLIARLEELNFPKLSTNIGALNNEKNYNYIAKIPIFSMTKEKLEKWKKQIERKMIIYEEYITLRN